MFEDDELVLAEATRVRNYVPEIHKGKKRRVESGGEADVNTWRRKCFSSLMQKILSFLYRKAKSTGKQA